MSSASDANKEFVSHVLLATATLCFASYSFLWLRARATVTQRGVPDEPGGGGEDNAALDFSPPHIRRQITVPAASVPEEIVARLRAIFKSLDTNGDDKLSVDELRKFSDIYRNMSPRQRPKDAYAANRPPKIRQSEGSPLDSLREESETDDQEGPPVPRTPEPRTPERRAPPAAHRAPRTPESLLWTKLLDRNHDGVVDFTEFCRHFLFMWNGAEDAVSGPDATRDLIKSLEHVLDWSKDFKSPDPAVRSPELRRLAEVHHSIGRSHHPRDGALAAVIARATQVFQRINAQGERLVTPEQLAESGISFSELAGNAIAEQRIERELRETTELERRESPRSSARHELCVNAEGSVSVHHWMHFFVSEFGSQQAAERRRVNAAASPLNRRIDQLATRSSYFDRIVRVQESCARLKEHNAQLVAAAEVLRLLNDLDVTVCCHQHLARQEYMSLPEPKAREDVDGLVELLRGTEDTGDAEALREELVRLQVLNGQLNSNLTLMKGAAASVTASWMSKEQ